MVRVILLHMDMHAAAWTGALWPVKVATFTCPGIGRRKPPQVTEHWPSLLTSAPDQNVVVLANLTSLKLHFLQGLTLLQLFIKTCGPLWPGPCVVLLPEALLPEALNPSEGGGGRGIRASVPPATTRPSGWNPMHLQAESSSCQTEKACQETLRGPSRYCCSRCKTIA